MPTEQINGIEIYYELHGEGIPLMMILGMGMNVASFNNPEVIARYAEHYRVIALDNRGIGRSGKPDAPWTVETMADDTLALMERLRIDRAHVVGGSLGACVAQVIAARHPERVRGLVLHGAAARYPRRMRFAIAASAKVPFLRRQSLKMAAPIFAQPYPPTETSYFHQCRAGAAFDGRRLLSRIAAPTLILNLARDQFVPPLYTRELADGISGSQLPADRPRPPLHSERAGADHRAGAAVPRGGRRGAGDRCRTAMTDRGARIAMKRTGDSSE